MKFIYALFALIILSNNLYSDDFQTYYEASGFKETPRYAETVAYCKKLEASTEFLKFTNFGTSPQGRELPLLIYDRNMNFSADAVRKSGNAVLFIQACIHPGESEGKDAGLMLLRDIIRDNKFKSYLDNVTLVFIPIFNVDGHERFSPYSRINQNGPIEMGWRTTANNFNLNREFMKADAPEMQSWLRLYNEWLPEMLVDCHTTDGSDYQYTVTYGIEIYGNTEANLSDWMRDKYISPLIDRLEKEDNILSFPYVMFRNWHDPKSGLQSRCSPAMLCGGYVALQNRASLLLETHSLKDYQTRVNATYKVIENTLKIVSAEKDNLQKLIKAADLKCSRGDLTKDKYPLQYDLTNDSIMIDFKAKEYYAKKSEITGKDYYFYTDKPVTYKIPYFKDIVPSEYTKLPLAYIIPAEWRDVIKRLEWHKIAYFYTNNEVTLSNVSTYKLDSIKLAETSYEGRQRVVSMKQKEITVNKTYPRMSAVVIVRQRAARVLVDFLEPASYDSFVKWGFFNNLFENKEYFETYVMEVIAEQMMKDPKIKEAFNADKAANPGKFIEQRDILNWFYERSPYIDSVKNVYPIGRIFDEEQLHTLISN